MSRRALECQLLFTSAENVRTDHDYDTRVKQTVMEDTQRGVAATKVNGSPRAVSVQLSAISSWNSALLRLDPEFLSK
jgi:hypothetical protein